MDLTIYKSPKQLITLQQLSQIRGSHICITQTKARIFFSTDVVENYKMISFPPTFAYTNEGEWVIILGQDTPDSFPLNQHQGTFFFSNSDLVNRILLPKGLKKWNAKFIKTAIPFVFKLETLSEKERLSTRYKKAYKHQREIIAPAPKSVSYHDMLLKINQPNFIS